MLRQHLNTTENVIEITLDNEGNMDNTVNDLNTNNLNNSNTNLLAENPPNVDNKNRRWKPMHKYSLFTCLEPNCNMIFKCFTSFQLHYRKHFTSDPFFMCWGCCSTYNSRKDLLQHKKLANCSTTGLFYCYQCHNVFSDIQSLSIHKMTVHNGKLEVMKNAITSCPICKKLVSKKSFQIHVTNCNKNNNSNKNYLAAGTSSNNK